MSSGHPVLIRRAILHLGLGCLLRLRRPTLSLRTRVLRNNDRWEFLSPQAALDLLQHETALAFERSRLRQVAIPRVTRDIDWHNDHHRLGILLSRGRQRNCTDGAQFLLWLLVLLFRHSDEIVVLSLHLHRAAEDCLQFLAL